MNRNLIFIFLTFALGVISFGCTQKKQTPEMGKNRRGGPVTVDVKVIDTKKIQDIIKVTGTILANEKVELKPEVSGRITGIFFTEGANVEKGKLLVKINDADLKAQLLKNEAQEKLLADDEFRQRKLLEIKAVSQEAYDATVNQLSIIKADKELLKAQIAKTEIYAPFAGKIGLRNVSPGNFVVSNTIVTTLQQLNPLKIEFDIPEKYSGQIREGQEIEFTTENNDNTYKAKIFARESGINTETRSLKVRALYANSDQKLIPGSFARVSVVLENIENAIMVPTEAILTEMTRKNVYVCHNGKAALTQVRTGMRSETEVQVTEGLQPGDSLIVTGLMQISNGSPVMVRPQGKNKTQQPK